MGLKRMAVLSVMWAGNGDAAKQIEFGPADIFWQFEVNLFGGLIPQIES